VLKEMAALASLLRNAQEIGDRLNSMAAQLKNERIVGNAGAGLVTVEVNGLAEVIRVSVDPSLINPSDKDLLEELLTGAMRDAVQKARERHLALMSELTGGVAIPGLDQISKLFGSG